MIMNDHFDQYCSTQLHMKFPMPCSNRNLEKLVNGFYFASTTLTTVGYGDVVPKGWVLQLLSVFYILFGVAIIGNIVISLVVELCETSVSNQAKGMSKFEQHSSSTANLFSLRLRHWLTGKRRLSKSPAHMKSVF